MYQSFQNIDIEASAVKLAAKMCAVPLELQLSGSCSWQPTLRVLSDLPLRWRQGGFVGKFAHKEGKIWLR